jgi:hypothetical protein
MEAAHARAAAAFAESRYKVSSPTPPPLYFEYYCLVRKGVVVAGASVVAVSVAITVVLLCGSRGWSPQRRRRLRRVALQGEECRSRPASLSASVCGAVV